MPDVRIGALERAEFQAFRALRLLALRTEPGVFSASHTVEQDFPDATWQDRIQGPGHQIFGAFLGERLVGSAGIFTSRDDPTGTTAIIGMLFVHPDARGHGLSSRLIGAALDWARARPAFATAAVAHRASNAASRRAILRHGFTEVASVTHCWPDGATEDEVRYNLALTHAERTTE